MHFLPKSDFLPSARFLRTGSKDRWQSVGKGGLSLGDVVRAVEGPKATISLSRERATCRVRGRRRQNWATIADRNRG